MTRPNLYSTSLPGANNHGQTQTTMESSGGLSNGGEGLQQQVRDDPRSIHSAPLPVKQASFLHAKKAAQTLRRRSMYEQEQTKPRSERILSGSLSTRKLIVNRDGARSNRPTSLVDFPIHEGTPLTANDVIKGMSESEKEALREDELDADEQEGQSEEQYNITKALTEMILGKGILSLCFLALPVAVVAVSFRWSASFIFWSSFVALIPLAALLSDFTEEVAVHTNDITGGLINASFGNAVEVVVAIQALRADEIRVVQASLLGSILSNLLLVLGSCFFFGGLFHSEQRFNTTAATANMGLLALSSIALVLPTPFADYYNIHDDTVLILSRTAACFLIFMYAQLLLFQLKTHVHLFEGGNSEEEAELATIPLSVAMLGLLITTSVVTIVSEFLVSSIEGFTEASGISRTFVGIILLPIVGNAVEHVSAVTIACRNDNKMDLAMGVAVGSCTQISLFVVPLSVLAGWMCDKNMTLNFPHFEIMLYILSVFTVSIILSNPVCNWLEGSLLITTYALVATGFWFEKVQENYS